MTKTDLIKLALQGYDNPSSKSVDDFIEDLTRLRHIKKSTNRYKKHGTINARLFVNHFILWFNVFNYQIGKELLFQEIDEDKHDIIYTVLNFLKLETSEENINNKLLTILKEEI